MACHVEIAEFGGVRTRVFWCGEGPEEPQHCACGAPGEFLCDWIMQDKRVSAPTVQAQVGDVWITQKGGKRARIVQIEDLDTRGQVTEDQFLSRRIWIQIPGHPTPYPYLRNNGEQFLTERPGTCDASCCYLHVREVDDDKHYCQGHWGAWEQAA